MKPLEGTGLMEISGRPLDELAVQFKGRGHRATVCAEMPVVALGAQGERVIVSDGRRLRVGRERGQVLGSVDAEVASAGRATRLVRQIARWS
ncbi:hypothetical protein OHR68_39155 [Spirillospora sp. NBC_00431]